jgi:hypothetical protein
MADKKIRTVRVSDELWERARIVAAAEGRQVSDLIRHWLTDYTAGRLSTARVDPWVIARLRSIMDELSTVTEHLE